MPLQVEDPFVVPGKAPTNRAPTHREFALALRAVNPETPVALAVPEDLLPLYQNQIAPLYERLLLEQRRDKRAAWKRWREAIDRIAQTLEGVPST